MFFQRSFQLNKKLVEFKSHCNFFVACGIWTRGLLHVCIRRGKLQIVRENSCLNYYLMKCNIKRVESKV